MKMINFNGLINKAISDLNQEIEDAGFENILTYDTVIDYIENSFKLDHKYRCMWCVNIDEVLWFATTKGLIEDIDYEDWSMEYNLGVKRNLSKNNI